MRITATFRGRDRHGHYQLHDLEGDFERQHAWVNGRYNSFPANVRKGDRIRFFASPHLSHGEMKLTDIRECQVIG